MLFFTVPLGSTASNLEFLNINRRMIICFLIFFKEWETWGPWEPCSVTCGDGMAYRYRRCDGYGCSGNRSDSKSCSVDCYRKIFLLSSNLIVKDFYRPYTI